MGDGGFTDEELEYLAERIVDTFIDRARQFVERVEVALDETKRHRQEQRAKDHRKGD